MDDPSVHITLFLFLQVKVIDRSAIVTTDAETKVSQPSSLQELIDKETGKCQVNYTMHCIAYSASCNL
jgi:hypothetical protein